jgi:hypothetical protein
MRHETFLGQGRKDGLLLELDWLVAKGRARGGRNIGERHPNHKLSWESVEAIRKVYAEGGISQRELALRYNVYQFAIGRIVRNDGWTIDQNI